MVVRIAADAMATDVPNRSNLKLTTLPPEIRSVIYSHHYPHQVTAVCRLLREETLPLLHQPNSTTVLYLYCENGRFTDTIRRRLPNHVYRTVKSIIILNDPELDELKPKLSTFPNLQLLYFDLETSVGSARKELAERGIPTRRGVRIAKADSSFGIDGRNARKSLLETLRQKHVEQEQPREGLERDYFPEDTLWEVVTKTRRKRGFLVGGRMRIISYMVGDVSNERAYAQECTDWVDLELDDGVE